MTEMRQVYKCEVCGNMIEVIHNSAGTLVCCGQNMTLVTENSQEAAVEKHIPVVEKIENGILVKVGSVPHPMLDKHYIEWIEVQTQNKVYRKYLKPGEKPEAQFMIKEEIIVVREYCNVHGLWKTNN